MPSNAKRPACPCMVLAPHDACSSKTLLPARELAQRRGAGAPQALPRRPCTLTDGRTQKKRPGELSPGLHWASQSLSAVNRRGLVGPLPCPSLTSTYEWLSRVSCGAEAIRRRSHASRWTRARFRPVVKCVRKTQWSAGDHGQRRPLRPVFLYRPRAVVTIQPCFFHANATLAARLGATPVCSCILFDVKVSPRRL